MDSLGAAGLAVGIINAVVGAIIAIRVKFGSARTTEQAATAATENEGSKVHAALDKQMRDDSLAAWKEFTQAAIAEMRLSATEREQKIAALAEQNKSQQLMINGVIERETACLIRAARMEETIAHMSKTLDDVKSKVSSNSNRIEGM